MSSMCCTRRTNAHVEALLARELGRRPTPTELRRAAQSDRTIVDDEQVRRALAGQRATLNRPELERVVVRLAADRRWGLTRIANHTGYSRSHINVIMKRLGITDPDASRR